MRPELGNIGSYSVIMRSFLENRSQLSRLEKLNHFPLEEQDLSVLKIAVGNENYNSATVYM
jgi:hypothetical protein